MGAHKHAMVKVLSTCCAAGDFDTARSWLLRAIKAARTLLGGDSKAVADLEKILAQRP